MEMRTLTGGSMTQMGRPKHFDEAVNIKFSTEKQTREELQQIAGEASLTLSRLINNIVQDYLKGRDKCTG